MNLVTFACNCKQWGQNVRMDPTAPHVAPSASVALRWLGRQLAWERTLAELRDPTVDEPAEDDVAA